MYRSKFQQAGTICGSSGGGGAYQPVKLSDGGGGVDKGGDAETMTIELTTNNRSSDFNIDAEYGDIYDDDEEFVGNATPTTDRRNISRSSNHQLAQ